MFEFTISKQQLLPPLLTVAGAVDKKQCVPILANILVKLSTSTLSFTATDLDIEITGCVPCSTSHGTGTITVPSKKMIDIIRTLDDDAIPTISFHESLMTIKVGRSQFKLTTLAADDYPNTEDDVNEVELSVERHKLIHLFQSTHFAMSQQDVRVYLNGLLLEIDSQGLTAVATDGHRMAISKLPVTMNNQHHRLLIPRKGIQEALRLLTGVEDQMVIVSAGKRQFKLKTQDYSFSTKLLEARFPPYNKAIPISQDKSVIILRDVLKRALSRITILANEKLRAILLQIVPGQLTLIANNQDQEEAVETLSAETEGDELQIGVNATYLSDVLQHIQDGPLRLSFSSADSSILLESLNDEHYSYIIMPMKL
ncbi:MAG: DNA polymerase III subunit beta [Legionellales bacterium]|nr:DNA polymerase III subunit beta [Legionellales bacterium]